MQKVLSWVGAIGLAFLFIYFVIYTPISKYQTMERRVRTLREQVEELQNEKEQIYKHYDQALRANFSNSQVEQFYGDKRFFQDEHLYKLSGKRYEQFRRL